MMTIRFAFLLLMALSFQTLHSQPTDSLEQARRYFDGGLYGQAREMAEPYLISHPGNLAAGWLLGQIHYMEGRMDAMEREYESAIAWHPENYTLRLDYALKLTETGKLKKAREGLNLYLSYDSVAPSVHEALARIAFWEGHLSTATKEISKVLAVQPDNRAALRLNHEIALTRATWVSAGAEGRFDDQPLQGIGPALRLGKWVNQWVNLTMEAGAPRFRNKGVWYQAMEISAANRIRLSRLGLTVKTGLGAYRFPDSTRAFTGEVAIQKLLLKGITLSLEAKRQPYLHTLANLGQHLVMMNYRAGLEWKRPKGLTVVAEAGYTDFFSDNNHIQNLGFWCLSPPAGTKKFAIRAGAGVGSSQAAESRFISKKSLETIVSTWDTTTVITGTYDPYFTPNNLKSVSLILTLQAQPLPSLNLSGKLSYGVFARVDNPYLFLNEDDQGQAVIETGYDRMGFHPVEANLSLTYQKGRFGLGMDYTYLETNFYKSHTGGIRLKYLFFNGKYPE